MKINIPQFDQSTVLVVGDLMLDRYWYGSTSRISPEAPVPVVHVKDIDERPGGAGNVALNLAALDCSVRLFSLVGQDEPADCLREKLQASGVECELEPVADCPTVTKLRVLGRNQQLIRLDFETGFAKHDKQKLLQAFEKQLANVGSVILSDYGKGVLDDPQIFIQAALKKNIPVLVDPKRDDFAAYRGASLITPNLKEFEAVVGPCFSEADMITKAKALIKAHDLGALLITRGEHGMSLVFADKAPLHLSSHASEVFDVTGAGDTVISLMAAAIAAKQDLETAAVLANTAAGIAVRKLGAATVSVPELRRAVQRQHNSELGMLTEEELLIAVEDARAHDETIVMTNGCFDVLHAGHIAYLQQAKELGKRLIVAVNDDASVKRLKGDDRPINTLKNRMAVLAALRVVDWVVPFSEDTPALLIEVVSPDILVKGGDYQAHEVVGYQHVTDNGGEVKILKFIEGCSTTRMIEKIREEVA